MQNYQQLIIDTVLHNPAFASATFSGAQRLEEQRGEDHRWKKLVIRPVMIKDTPHLQFSFFDDKQNIVKNYAGDELAGQFQAVLALPFRHFHIHTADETLQITLSKKGKALVSRSHAKHSIDLAHDRQKNTILMEGEDIPFLKAIGMMTNDGRIKADMRNKFKQINAFLQLLAGLDEIHTLPEPIRVVDFGCGSAYLTFAAYHYLHEMLGKDVHIIGVDMKDKLMQKNAAIAQQLGWDAVQFQPGMIADFKAEAVPDIVVALHACDTASDDAIAQGIRWQSRVILAAPCCHHHLQAQLNAQPTPPPFAPVLRYGLLHERMGDMLTDSFRALILRMHGYKVDLLEFVAPDHTPKNLLIRAVQSHQPQGEDEYQQLREYWGVTPYLEQILDS